MTDDEERVVVSLLGLRSVRGSSKLFDKEVSANGRQFSAVSLLHGLGDMMQVGSRSIMSRLGANGN